MLRLTVTEAFVSDGYQGEPAITITTDEKGRNRTEFRVGVRRYAQEGETRWINFTVKSWNGAVAEKIRKMQLTARDRVNLIARFDVDEWIGKDGNQKRRNVLILDSPADIEFASLPPKTRPEEPKMADSADCYVAPTTQPVVDQSTPQMGGFNPLRNGSYIPFGNQVMDFLSQD